ncbi:hypothetical protein BDN72DRAFT_903615 [Pluteus cervinus]|uniref:Uncharacterized protein n=1 Tax=Pluteus cervinus TaxID=181527 RepID=A0ACD3A8Q7_9AGAR|nr:hypothetical protein BDN72DRAFT_903615 [Pluteus cervinus]
MKLTCNEDLKYGPLFNVVYHTQCSSALVEATTHQMPKDEGKLDWNQMFQHSTIDLATLFNQVRECGELPSSKQAEVIQEFIQECNDDIKSLTSTLSDIISSISRLSRELSDTSIRLSQTQGQIALGEYLLSPDLGKCFVRSLPQDVLEQIFLACLDSRTSYTPSLVCPPLQLSSVCHRWRTIALSMPKVWEDVSVSTNPRLFSLAREWTSRCSSYNLSVKIQDSDTTESLLDFLVFLQTSPSKLRLLDFAFGSLGEANDIWSHLFQLDCSELREVVLRGQHPRIELPHSASQLKRLYVFSLPVSWEHTAPPPQLTVLTITRAVHWSILEHILLHCPALRCLVIAIAGHGIQRFGSSSQGEQTSVSQITTHSHLESLCFINDCKEDNIPTNLLHNFVFPALNAFEYYLNPSGREPAPWLTSLNFMDKIHRLTLHISDFPQTLLMPVLTAAISLQEINICCNREHLEGLLSTLTSLQESRSVALDLRGIQLASGSPFSSLRDYTPSFIKFIQSISNPTESGRPQRLTHFGIGSWCDHDAGSSVGEFQSILDNCEKINVKLYQDATGRLLYSIPRGFEMYDSPYYEGRGCDILQHDGTWKRQLGSVFRVGE